MRVRALRLCLVTSIEGQSLEQYEKFIQQAVEGGVTAIQLRAKSLERTAFQDLALRFKKILQPYCIPLIINDHVDIADAIDAEGVHIGQSDLPPAIARQMLGPKKIIGLSIENMQQLEIANRLDCINYVAASAVFPSKTKLDCKTIWGISGLQNIVKLSRHPVMAIGGIDASNVAEVIDAGVSGVAVVNAIHGQSNPKEAAAKLITQIDQHLEERKTCKQK